MTDTSTIEAEPLSKCGACGQTDDHPKHQIAVGCDPVNGFYHQHDFDRNGCIHYHFDCESDWHDLHSRMATTPRPPTSPDEPWTEWLEEQAAEHRAIADTHAAIIEKCKAGTKGQELRQWIVNLHGVRGGAGGLDSTAATAALGAWNPNSGTTTVGSKTYTGPIKERLMTANGSDTALGTELTTSGGYTAGGASVSMGTAASESISSNAATSWTGMPSTTLTGEEQWDSSGTPQRTFWAPWSGGNIVVASGNTFTVPSGQLQDTLA